MPAIDDANADVVLAMAEHFLDTETRHRLPHTASLCVRAGLNAEQVRSLWCHDVAPVVGMNLLSPAGEWAGWNRDWLLRQIAARRARGRGWWGRWRNGWSRRMQPGNPGDLASLSRFVAVLSDTADVIAHDRMLADLLWLARCFFAMPLDEAAPSPTERQRLLHRYERHFRLAMAPALLGNESGLGEQRIRATLLGEGAGSQPIAV